MNKKTNHIKGVVQKSSWFAKKINKNTKERVRRIVEENDTKAGQFFDVSIQILIIFSLVIYSLGTLSGLPPLWNKIINIIDILCYFVFTVEYFARIYVAKKPLQYILSFYGIIDLLAILPFLFARQFDLRAIRALRVLRVMSALKMSRYNESLQRFRAALNIIKPELTLFFIVSGIFIFLSSAGIYYFENEEQPKAFASIFHSLWWAVITLTTVGYGDVYPITTGGKTFTFFILIIGLGIVTIPAGLIASALSEARNVERELREKKKREKENIKNQKE